MRNLLLFLVLLVVVYLVRRALSRSADERARPDAPSAPAASREPGAETRETEQVVPCAHCGVLAPPSEGVTRGVNFYCSPEHADLGPRV